MLAIYVFTYDVIYLLSFRAPCSNTCSYVARFFHNAPLLAKISEDISSTSTLSSKDTMFSLRACTFQTRNHENTFATDSHKVLSALCRLGKFSHWPSLTLLADWTSINRLRRRNTHIRDVLRFDGWALIPPGVKNVWRMRADPVLCGSVNCNTKHDIGTAKKISFSVTILVWWETKLKGRACCTGDVCMWMFQCMISVLFVDVAM